MTVWRTIETYNETKQTFKENMTVWRTIETYNNFKDKHNISDTLNNNQRDQDKQNNLKDECSLKLNKNKDTSVSR